jgi:hypothetical protein
VTDRLRATRKRSSGPGRLILTLQRIGTYRPSLPSRLRPAYVPVTPWPGLYRPRSTSYGTVGPASPSC